ncbi:MAG: helix-turn-helix domain-containing protein [Emcibacteraceae bacterium]|nr:helix-turn-helix domain-containing protein [Emcibacteraceae bacterium]
MTNMVTPAQIRMARAALKLGVKDLSVLASVGINTITRYERGGNVTVLTLQKIVEALSERVIFLPENGDGPGVRIRNISMK